MAKTYDSAEDLTPDELLDEIRVLVKRRGALDDDEQAIVREYFLALDKHMQKDDCPADWGGEEADDDGDEDE